MTEVEKVCKSTVSNQKPVEKRKSVPVKQRHPHLTCFSPLRVRDKIPFLYPLPPVSVQKLKEREYVVDAVKTDVVSIFDLLKIGKILWNFVAKPRFFRNN